MKRIPGQGQKPRVSAGDVFVAGKAGYSQVSVEEDNSVVRTLGERLDLDGRHVGMDAIHTRDVTV